MLGHIPIRLCIPLALGLLVACGGANGSSGAASGAPAAATSPAPGAAPPTAQPTGAPQRPTTAALTANALTADTHIIPAGLTPEGYHMLGRADAPVTLTMYSDFL